MKAIYPLSQELSDTLGVGLEVQVPENVALESPELANFWIWTFEDEEGKVYGALISYLDEMRSRLDNGEELILPGGSLHARALEDYLSSNEYRSWTVKAAWGPDVAFEKISGPSQRDLDHYEYRHSL